MHPCNRYGFYLCPTYESYAIRLGLGTRLKPFTNSHPKALAAVNGKTLLQINIEYLLSYGIEEIIVNVHHFADQIEKTLKKHDNFGAHVHISDEREEVLETGGGLKHAAHFLDDEKNFVIMNVDVLTDLDLAKMIAYHEGTDARATLAVMNRKTNRKFLFDTDMTLCGWRNAEKHEERISRPLAHYEEYAFSGIHVASSAVLQTLERFDKKFSLVDVYLLMARHHLIKGHDHSGDRFIDVGKPQNLEEAQEFFN